MQKQPLPQYYTPEEVAASLGVTRRSVYEWLLNGTLKAGKAGRRWVITPAQVEAFVAIRQAPQAVPVQAAGVKTTTRPAPGGGTITTTSGKLQPMKKTRRR